MDALIEMFEAKHKLLIPQDLKEYFHKTDKKELADYGDFLFTFYGIDEFKSVKDEVGDYGGIPNYRKIVKTLPDHEHCFVFAEYMIHSGIYAIKLFEKPTTINNVYVIVGHDYKQVANNFSEFIESFKRGDEGLFI
ncbi:hypothetical protein CKK33_12815 [Mucilaginibacter sp. MD40]|uniref:SMI1/KNR4 family protein n=1 Tax=Mucilaginibacter sp. MD40 TaxID=2029590 RepID=UPI000BACDB36|nr:SMI1/KNR4 family protein [Mucilaginibacter sp. MD40]PAW94321.1 hypothetical protein CKK33_12815 [Mucilaginibacter sp. MD40]